jgi:hypothetical protein
LSVDKTLQYWRAACDVREKFKIVKPVLPAKPQYRYVQEFTNKQDLEPLSLDLDAIRMQSLLICERCLGTTHKDMIYRLMYRGAAYADSLQYQHCIDLWKYALELRVAKDSILFCDTSFTAQALVKLYLDLYEKHAEGILNTSVQLEDVVSTIELLVSDLQEFNGGDDIFQLDAGIEDPFCMFFVQIKVQFDKGLCSETSVTEKDRIFGHTQFKGILPKVNTVLVLQRVCISSTSVHQTINHIFVRCTQASLTNQQALHANGIQIQGQRLKILFVGKFFYVTVLRLSW